MNKSDINYLSEHRKAQLRKERKSVRKIGVVLLIFAVLFMPIASAVHFGLVGVSGVLAVIGGIMVARSYIHVKYQGIDK